MQKVSESDCEILYAVTSPSNITAELVISLMDLGKRLRFEWPRQILTSNIFMELSDRYFVQVGMDAPKLIYESQSPGLSIDSFDDETSKRYVAESYETGYAKVWIQQLSSQMIERFRAGVTKLANNRTTRFVQVDGRPVGLAIVANLKTYRGEFKDHMAWIWIDAKLQMDFRKAVGACLVEAAAQLAPAQILAGIFVRNVRSMSFARKAGFESVGATVIGPNLNP